MAPHCQICGRMIKANTGTIAHHGYKRPGDGWQTASCFGAKFRPYEVACDALPRAIELAEAFKARAELALATMQSSPPAELKYTVDAWGKLATVTRPDGFNPASPTIERHRRGSYESVYRNAIWKLQGDIQGVVADLEYLRKRLADWKVAE
ncbi:MAG: hypothetical protein HXX10_07560 [Rhodoplanes sp.]|uniref:hypothetical protein n=1 Tax=Rhodoplanes sp. TaxID=1968906 RepID=UPI00185A8E5D|nr:hypothetical protein [Rhodoplanes sp.]NVO13877.1 hypothetical protein [Rhodoplanes sp.]